MRTPEDHARCADFGVELGAMGDPVPPPPPPPPPAPGTPGGPPPPPPPPSPDEVGG